MLNHNFKLASSKFYLFLLASVYFMSIGSILFLSIFWLYKILLIVAATYYAKTILSRSGTLTHPYSVHSISRDKRVIG